MWRAEVAALAVRAVTASGINGKRFASYHSAIIE
jgi:hypothetical protein